MKRILRAVSAVVTALLLTAAGVGTLATLTSCAPVLAAGAPPSTQTVVTGAQQVSPDEYYHQVWDLINQHFLYQERLADWSKWEHKYDGKLNTYGDARRAINEMLDSLGDKYTYFKNAALTKAKADRDDATNVVSHRMLPGNIGYIRITTFSSNNTADETEAALKALSGADAYILDLRGNGGGYVKESMLVFSLLVDNGSFTTLRGRYQGKPYNETVVVAAQQIETTENGTLTTSARKPNLAGRKPVMVLVDKDTASASEMLSGALRDNGRVEILGTKTFGKGIAQITPSLPRETSVQITYARYYFPGGASIHGVGITPHRVVTQSGLGDRQLDVATVVIAKKLGR